MRKIADLDLAAVLANPVPSVVDIYADWCQPCKMLAPTLDKLSKDYDGKVDFVKMDGETEVKTSATYKVSALPTLLFFDKGGKLAKQLIGLQTEKAIKTVIESLL